MKSWSFLKDDRIKTSSLFFEISKTIKSIQSHPVWATKCTAVAYLVQQTVDLWKKIFHFHCLGSCRVPCVNYFLTLRVLNRIAFSAIRQILGDRQSRIKWMYSFTSSKKCRVHPSKSRVITAKNESDCPIYCYIATITPTYNTCEVSWPPYEPAYQPRHRNSPWILYTPQ